jgi:hypothetical protein
MDFIDCPVLRLERAKRLYARADCAQQRRVFSRHSVTIGQRAICDRGISWIDTIQVMPRSGLISFSIALHPFRIT